MKEGTKYKTTRISYITSYFIIPLLLFFLSFLYFLLTNSLWFTAALYICITIVIILFFEPEIERIMRQYYITNNEIMKVEGILSKKTTIIPYQGVADVKVIKGIMGRIFNFGDVIVTGVKGEINMKGIKNPDEVYKIIKNKISSKYRKTTRREKED